MIKSLHKILALACYGVIPYYHTKLSQHIRNTQVKNFKTRNRIKIPNHVAVLAAIILLVSSVATPTSQSSTAAGTSLTQQLNDAVVEPAVIELATVAATVSKPATFTISSLIFRF
ncbi:MAG: hypothetical protein SH820_13625 [Xanthomonadales bacterium]|nr:hypothetical protein [Xanthomonadales bacterium]